MADSFWSDNPCVPGWLGRVGSWWNEEAPKLLCTTNHKFPIISVKGYTLFRANESHASLLSSFWSRYFLQSKVCKCVVPVEHIQSHIRDGIWEVYIVQHTLTKGIVGSIVRRWLSKLHIQNTIWDRAGMVDYFCVHPEFQKKGIGRWLLTTLHNQSPTPMPPHLILWEGYQIKVPPIVSNSYYVKHRPKLYPMALAMAKQNIPYYKIQNPVNVWKECVKGRDIWTEEGSFREVSVYKVPAGIVAVWNTFHKSIPGGEDIGIVLYGNAIALDQFSTVGPFGVLLSAGCPEGSQGWTHDSSFQFVGYNLSSNFSSSQIPLLAL